MRVTASPEVTPGEWFEADGQRLRTTPYFGVRLGDPYVDGPQGFRVDYPEAGAVVRPHFHPVRQFQVIVGGTGRLGKKPLAPYTFHYADPNTPYGPIVADGEGISFFTLRPEMSGGIYYMPGSKDKMPGRAGRNFAARFDADPDALHRQTEPVLVETLMEPEPDGMQAIGVRLRPGADTTVPAAEGSGGQYHLVAAGSLIHEGKALPQNSLLWVEPDDPAPVLVAGPSGAAVLVMQFPVRMV